MKSRPFMRLVILLFLLLSFVGIASAEMREVAPGVRVTKKSYDAPFNEQPFFGFADLTMQQKAANLVLIAEASKQFQSRKKAADAALQMGWKAFLNRDYALASRRFNQAYLLDPESSAVYHSFAVLAHERFSDLEYAEELFKIAKSLPNPMQTLNADYGRLLGIMKRPRDAQPLLEQAVIDMPNFGTAWSNLAFARFLNGDGEGACVAVKKAKQLRNPPNVQSDLALLTARAKCDGAG
jgi:Tfp pilus assembly protein PilF